MSHLGAAPLLLFVFLEVLTCRRREQQCWVLGWAAAAVVGAAVALAVAGAVAVVGGGSAVVVAWASAARDHHDHHEDQHQQAAALSLHDSERLASASLPRRQGRRWHLRIIQAIHPGRHSPGHSSFIFPS